MSSSSGESDEEDYEVDKITGHKRQDGEYVYKVRIVIKSFYSFGKLSVRSVQVSIFKSLINNIY